MGIDIYLHWRGQTEEEEQKQVTGFSGVHGHVGYLREAYHGGPYVTKYLVAEAFGPEHREAAIPAATLRGRLPTAVLMHIYREHKLYGAGKNPARLDGIEKLSGALAAVFSREMPDISHEAFAASLNTKSIETAKQLIEGAVLKGTAKAFVDFVELCERKERETGSPCTIEASY